MNITANTIDEYLSKTGEREPWLRQVDEAIAAAAPTLERKLFVSPSMTMISYGLADYQTKSMKEPSLWPLIALANQKNYMALYICAVEDGQYIAEKNASRLGKVNCGKSCIRFKKLDDINITVVQELVADIARRHNQGEKLFSL